MAHHAHTPHQHESPDAWHTHTVDEHPQEAHGEQIQTLKVAIVGVIGYALTVFTIVVLCVYFFAYKSDEQGTREEFPEKTLGDAAALQKAQLDYRDGTLAALKSNTAPRWTDAKAGLVTIPMDRAMTRVIDSYKGRK